MCWWDRMSHHFITTPLLQAIGEYDGPAVLFEREQFSLYAASVLRNDLFDLITA